MTGAQQALTSGVGLTRLHFFSIAQRVFAALAGVALATDPVHRNRERRMRFGADRTQGHGPRGEAPDDRGGGLHLVQGDRFALVKAKIKKAAQGHVATTLIVDDARVFLIRTVIIRSG